MRSLATTRCLKAAGLSWMRQVCHSLIIVLVSILCLLPASAIEPGKTQSRIFYVRQTIGDDASDGLSAATAWRSFSMLESAVQAGDTAYVGPGLYRETSSRRHQRSQPQGGCVL